MSLSKLDYASVFFMNEKKRLIIALFIIAFLVGGSLLAFKMARGYRPDIKTASFWPSGLLVATSEPKGAQVFIDGKLTTATDNTINLPPGEYDIRITKIGFLPWEKKLEIEKELVTQTDAVLLPAVPQLTPLTFSGVSNPSIAPNGQKLVYATAPDMENPAPGALDKSGLFLMDLTERRFGFNRDQVQLTRNTARYDFTKARLAWSPDSNKILVSFPNANFLLDAPGQRATDSLLDVTAQLPIIEKEWQEEIAQREAVRIAKLPELMQKVATESARILSWSPDETKLLYEATASAQITEPLVTPLPASNSQPQERDVQTGRIYVYDIKEDRNFFIEETKNLNLPEEKNADTLYNILYTYSEHFPLFWHPSSRHLVYVEQEKVVIMEYDNTNRVNVYAGPFEDNYVYIYPNGSKLLIITNINRDSPLAPNLYAIGLR